MKINELDFLTSSGTEKETATKPRAHARREEGNLQRQCVAWFRIQYRSHGPMLFAVPNGGGRSRVEAAIMKAEGVTAGVADLILLEPRGGWGALCIEMKTRNKKSKQRDSQKEWQAAAEAAGNRYEVCRTFEQFKAVIDDYMGLPRTNGRIVVHYAEVDRSRLGICMGYEQSSPDLY